MTSSTIWLIQQNKPTARRSHTRELDVTSDCEQKLRSVALPAQVREEGKRRTWKMNAFIYMRLALRQGINTATRIRTSRFVPMSRHPRRCISVCRTDRATGGVCKHESVVKACPIPTHLSHLTHFDRPLNRLTRSDAPRGRHYHKASRPSLRLLEADSHPIASFVIIITALTPSSAHTNIHLPTMWPTPIGFPIDRHGVIGWSIPADVQENLSFCRDVQALASMFASTSISPLVKLAT